MSLHMTHAKVAVVWVTSLLTVNTDVFRDRPEKGPKLKLKLGETICLEDANGTIAGRWDYPENNDICNLAECFCYCNEHKFFFTIFFPAAPSSTRRRNTE